MAPVFVHHLSSYLGVKAPEEPAPPMLSLGTAATLSVLYTIIYVLPFYLHPTTRPSPLLYRDSPSVIQTRIRLVSTSVLFCTFVTTYVLAQNLHLTRLSILHSFGIFPTPFVTSILNPLLLTASLFAGPLFEKGIVDGEWRQWVTLRPIKDSLRSWTGYRNYVAGPFTEEILFRALIISLHLQTPPKPLHHHHPPLRVLILYTPLYFGIAHIHHCYEQRLTHPSIPFVPIFLSSVVQFAYTTVFGWYAAFIYLRTGSLWGVVAVHSFCNCMGLPRLWGAVGGEIVEAATNVVGKASIGAAVRGKEDREVNGTAENEWKEGKRRRRLSIWWTVAYYFILLSGVVGWWTCLGTLTESKAALVDFSI